MIWATEYKHVDLVKLLLTKGSDVNIRDNVSLAVSVAGPDPWGVGPEGGQRARVCRVATEALQSWEVGCWCPGC